MSSHSPTNSSACACLIIATLQENRCRSESYNEMPCIEFEVYRVDCSAGALAAFLGAGSRRPDIAPAAHAAELGPVDADQAARGAAADLPPGAAPQGLGWHVHDEVQLDDLGVVQATMAFGRPAACCVAWSTVLLDFLQVTGQLLLDVLAWDWSSAKELLGRHRCGRHTTPVLSNRSQALPPSPLSPRPAGQQLLRKI